MNPTSEQRAEAYITSTGELRMPYMERRMKESYCAGREERIEEERAVIAIMRQCKRGLVSAEGVVKFLEEKLGL